MKTLFILALLMTLSVSGSVASGQLQFSNLESSILDRFLEQKHHGNWQRIDPKFESMQGVPGLRGRGFLTTTTSPGIYMQFDQQGDPKDLLLARAHFGDPDSSPTQRQNGFGRASRSSLLAMIGQYYAEAADDFRAGIFSQSSSSPSVTRGVATLPMRSGKRLYLWFDFKKKKWMFYGPAGVTGALIMRKLYSLSSYLEKASARIVPYRSEIFYLKTTGNDIIRVTAIDSDTGNLVSEPRKMRISTLPKKIQSSIHAKTVKSGDSDLLKKPWETEKSKPVEEPRLKTVSPVKKQEKEKSSSLLAKIETPKVQDSPFMGLHFIPTTGEYTVEHEEFESAAFPVLERDETDVGPSRTMIGPGGLKLCCLPAPWISVQFPSATINPTDRWYNSHPILKNMALQIPLTSTKTITRLVEGRHRPIRSSRTLAYGTVFPGYINLESNEGPFKDGRIAAAIGTGVGMGVGVVGISVGTAGAGTAISTLTGLLGGAAVLTGGVVVAAIAAGATFHYLFNLQDAKTNQQRVEYLLESVQKNLSEKAP